MSYEPQITVDAADARSLSSFWHEVFGYVHPAPPGMALSADADALAAWDRLLSEAGVPEDRLNDRSAIEDPQGVGPRLFFQKVPEGKSAKNRMHVDVRCAPGLEGEERMAALESECRRLVGLGARRLERHEPDGFLSAGHIVLADPEGNEFCLD